MLSDCKVTENFCYTNDFSIFLIFALILLQM